MSDELDGIQINTQRGSIMPEGVHTFRVTEGEVREGPSGPYLNFTCEVEEGGDWDGDRVWTIVSLSPAARWKMDEWLDAHMVPAGDPIKASHFIGKLFRGKVKHDAFDGKTRPKIEAFLPAAEKKSGRTPGRARTPGTTAKPVPAVEETGMTAEVATDKGLPEDVVKPKRKGF